MYRDRYPYYDGEVYDDTGVVFPENIERRPNGRRVIVEEPEDYGMPNDRGVEDEYDERNPFRGGHSMQPWNQSPFDHFDRLFETPFAGLDRGSFGGMFGNIEQSLRRLEEDFARGAGRGNAHVYSFSSKKHFGPEGEVYEESTTTTREGNRTEVRRHLKDSAAGNEEYAWKREIDGRGREVIRRRDGSGQEVTKENYYNLTPEERAQFEQQWRTLAREGLDWRGSEGNNASLPQLSDRSSWMEHDRNEHRGGLGGFFRKLFKHD
ncbi:hypothetical protein Gasu2_55870 [Galdieria sulphuraria]|nr:hypothetical protein Gasu2_55870 [Galdieria sulphuraria]